MCPGGGRWDDESRWYRKYLVCTLDAPYTQGLDRKCGVVVRLGAVIHKGNGCIDGHGEALHVVVAMLEMSEVGRVMVDVVSS